MNILVTGAAGFIGFSLCKKFLDNTNYVIYGVDNIDNYYSVILKKKRIKELKKNKNFKFLKLDLKNNKTFKLLNKKKFKFIFHLAAQPGVRFSTSDPKRYIDENIIAFTKVLEFSRLQKCLCTFYASSSSVYGDSKKFPLSENDYINPKNIYGLTKKINEEISNLIAVNNKISIIGLRFFTVFGEWGRPDMLIFRYLKSSFNRKEKFYLNNYGHHTRDFTYINDINKILYNLLNKKHPSKHHVFNICSNNPIKITKILDLINKITKKKPKIIKRSFQKADVIKTHGNNLRIRKYIKINKFTNIKKSISNTVEWYKKNWKIFI